jgi:MFS family permease
VLISVRAIAITGFIAWFSAFFVLAFPADGLHSAVKELWQYPLIYLPEVFAQARLADRVTLFGMAIGFIFCGGLCDRVGRYKTMLICLTLSPFCATICGYFSDVGLFIILHFLVGLFVGGTLVSSTAFIFESVPSGRRWRMFNLVIIGGVFGAILSLSLGMIGWRSLYQIQMIPIFFVPLLWHWFDEPLIWKFAVRDKDVGNTEKSQSASNQLAAADNAGNVNNTSSENNSEYKKNLQRFFASTINKLANTYFVSISEMLLNRRRHLLVPALLLTFFGVCGMVLSLISFGNAVRQNIYCDYDLDVRTALRVQSGEIDVNDVDVVLAAYIIEKPLILEIINVEDSRIDLLPKVLRSYGYSRDDVPACVADGLFELVRRLRGERITKELVMDRAVMRWNSKFYNGRAEIDIPESDKNRIKSKAGSFLAIGEQTLLEILIQNQQTNDKNKNRDLASERRKTNIDKWQEWCDEFLLLWDNLLTVTENRYEESEVVVYVMKLFFLTGSLCCGLIVFLMMFFNWANRSWSQRRIFCAVFLLSALLSMMAIMLSRVGLSFWFSRCYIFVCGGCAVLLITCYLTVIPAMFPVSQRGAAIGFCFGVPLLVVFVAVCSISVPYVFYLVPICFVSGVFVIGMPARKSRKIIET